MLEVTKLHEKEYEYPIARRNLESGIIVLFLSEGRGVVIRTSPDSESKFGDVGNDWTSCRDKAVWEDVDITITG